MFFVSVAEPEDLLSLDMEGTTEEVEINTQGEPIEYPSMKDKYRNVFF